MGKRRAGRFHGGLRRFHGLQRPQVPGMNHVVIRLRHITARNQLLIAGILLRGVIALHQRLFEHGPGVCQVRRPLFLHGGDVAALHPGQNLSLPDAAALFHQQFRQAAGHLGRHRRLALGNNVAAGIQDGQGLGRVNHRNGGHIHRGRRRNHAQTIENDTDRQQNHRAGNEKRLLFPASRHVFPGR